MLRFSEKINELAAALAAAQAEITGAKKSSVNPHFKAKYADLEDSWDAIREVLPKHGLSVFQGGSIMDGKPVFCTLLMHTSGQWAEGTLPLACKDPSDPQKVGSAITYMRRYGLKAAVGLTDTDDDGNAGSKPGSPPAQSEPERMPEGQVMEMLTRIAGAGTFDDVALQCKIGLEEAKKYTDREAAARMLQAKKKRLAEFPTITEDGEVVE